MILTLARVHYSGRNAPSLSHLLSTEKGLTSTSSVSFPSLPQSQVLLPGKFSVVLLWDFCGLEMKERGKRRKKGDRWVRGGGGAGETPEKRC